MSPHFPSAYVPFSELPPERALEWVLWRLSDAIGTGTRGEHYPILDDAAEIVEQAEDIIWRYKELCE